MIVKMNSTKYITNNLKQLDEPFGKANTSETANTLTRPKQNVITIRNHGESLKFSTMMSPFSF